MSSAISNALSGLTANSNAINIISNNLANLSTSGFKAVGVSFEDLVSEVFSGTKASQVSGSTTAVGTQQFTQGAVQTTGNSFDAAIQGAGYFVTRDASGQQLLTRQGNFTADLNGNLITQSGQHVQGWNAVNGVLSTTGVSGNITLPTGAVQPPLATTKFALGVNLSSSATIGTSSGTFSSPIQIVDALGNTHTLTVTYTETAPNAWNYAVTIPSQDLAAGVPPTTTLGSGALTFDGGGNLLTPDLATGAIPIPITGLVDGATNLNLTWNLYDTTTSKPLIAQNKVVSSNISSAQDGIQSGQLTGVSIGNNGVIIATFSNGNTASVAQIALASVVNPQSLAQLDGNSWVPTSATATPVIGTPASGARGEITGGALESSTVDIATEFTHLLQYERGYQANSKVITTADNIVQQTISLIPNA